MPFITIYSTKEISLKKDFIEELRKTSAQAFTCKESKIYEHDFSIIHHVLESAQLSREIEIRITAHNFPSRIKRIDEIASSIQSAMEGIPWGQVKVFVFLIPIGMRG